MDGYIIIDTHVDNETFVSASQYGSFVPVGESTPYIYSTRAAAEELATRSSSSLCDQRVLSVNDVVRIADGVRPTVDVDDNFVTVNDAADAVEDARRVIAEAILDYPLGTHDDHVELLAVLGLDDYVPVQVVEFVVTAKLDTDTEPADALDMIEGFFTNAPLSSDYTILGEALAG